MLCKLAHVIFIILLVYRLQTTEHIPVNQNGFCIYFAIFFHMQRMDERIEKISGARWWVDQYFSLITERIPIFSGFEKVIFGVSFGKKKICFLLFISSFNQVSSNGTMKSMQISSFANQIYFSISLFYLCFIHFLLLQIFSGDLQIISNL